jgi:hypothetical protein
MSEAEQPPPVAAGFYGRVSGDDDESIQSQLMVARETAAKEGFYIPNDPEYVFSDVHVSGVTTSRNGFDQLLRQVEDRATKFSRLYIRGVNRFGRWSNVRLYDYHIVHFYQHGVVIRFCDVERHLDFSEGSTDSDFGLYLASKVEDFKAAKERTDIIRAMKRGKRKHVINGQYPSVATPYGTDLVWVNPDTDEVVHRRELGQIVRIPDCKRTLRFTDDRRIDAVKFIFRRILEGQSLRKIAKELTAGSYPPPKSKRWHGSAVGGIARNPIYFGTMVWGTRKAYRWIESPPKPEVTGSDPVVIPGFVPDPPITREVFLAAAEKISGITTLYRSGRRPTGPKYLFTGKIRCARCGLLYMGNTQKKPRIRIYYIHPNSGHPQCDACPARTHHLRAAAFEAEAFALVRSMLTTTDLEARVRAEVERRLGPGAKAQLDGRIKKILKQIRNDEEALQRLIDELEKQKGEAAKIAIGGRITKKSETIGAARSELDLMQSERERLVATLDIRSNVLAERETLLSLLNGDSFNARRALVERVLEVIEVDGRERTLTVALRYA